VQTFAEWLEDQLAARGWSAADLTAASQDVESPRGLDSGLISRWRRRDARAVVPTQAKTLARLARALSLPESEVYRAAGQLPADSVENPREQIDARRQLVRDQLDRWLAAVGPEHEDYFWEALKAQGDSVVDLIRQVGTAVNEGAQAAVNAAVSGRKTRTRPKRGDSGGALKDYYRPAGRVLGRHHFSVTAAAAL